MNRNISICRRISPSFDRSTTARLIFVAAAILLSSILPGSASATSGQTSITLIGGVSTVVQSNNTSWSTSKVLNSLTPNPNDPSGNTGSISWTVTVTKTSVSDTYIEADGYLTVQNTGAYPATIGNIIVNLQQFKQKCGTYKNVWASQAADMADGDNGAGAATDNIVAAASQEVVAANKACGANNYTTQKYTYQKNTYVEGTFATGPGSGTVAFNYLGNNWFSIEELNNVIPAGQTLTLTYQAKFDNTVLKLPAGTQIRTETLVTFGNAGARGGSGASAPNIDIDGDGGVDAAEGETWVRSVPTRTSLQEPSTCINCNQLVTLTDTPADITRSGAVVFDPSTFSFIANNGDLGVTALTDNNGNAYFQIDGSQLTVNGQDTFTVTVNYSVADCGGGMIYNTAHLDTYEYLVSAPYSWDASGDLLLQIGTDPYGDPINVVICPSLDQQPSDSEPISSGDNSCTINPPPPPFAGNYCTFTQAQWPHNPGGTTLASLMSSLGSATIGSTYTAAWNSASAVEAYLPAGGTNGALNETLLDPTNTSAGHFGGEALALQLNADLGASGLQVNGSSVSNFGNLYVCGTRTPLDGSTVGQVLGLVNTAVGRAGLPSDCTGQGACDFNSLDTLLQHLNVSFQQCHVTGFALHHLSETGADPSTGACL